MKRLVTLLGFLAASPAFSQGFEAALVGGYTTPGGIEQKALGIQDLELAGSFSWGASAAFFFSPRFGVEASWTRQQSALEIGTTQGSARLFDVNIDQVQGSFVYQLGGEPSRLRPFFTVGPGAAFLSATDLDGETKLSFGAGAGLRWLPTSRFGARLQARYTPTYLDDSSASDFCDPFGFCQSWLHQFELTGGLVVRF
ncbi:MAG TPA: outer membrane beta-barrel protein [Vicinamibacteria bacterium]|nr:outer membrane beta-barrel protein [Vicinamibacteria bacterium]